MFPNQLNLIIIFFSTLYEYFKERNSFETIYLNNTDFKLKTRIIDYSIAWKDLSDIEIEKNFIFLHSKKQKTPIFMIPKRSFENFSEESKFVNYCKNKIIS